ncbi:MAG: DUF4349 domain-containing protein [Clostridia bacterium]|nr:DUF4349 domain-containing protein [Clostridia bacterium]
MKLNEYEVLLNLWLDGEITEEEEAQLLSYELDHPECASRRQALHTLQQEMASLNEDIPPMPSGLHAAWMQKVEEEHMQPMENHPAKEKRSWNRKRIFRIVSVAAALVFLIGGTSLMRDSLPGKHAYPSGYVLSRSEDAEQNTASYAGNNLSMASRAKSVEAGAGYMAAESAVMDSVPMEEMAFADEYDYETEDVTADTSVSYDAGSQAVSSTKIIRNASLAITTTAFDQSLKELESLCKACGGWIASNNTSTRYNGLRNAYLEMRIPSGEYEHFLSQTGETGRTTSRSESTYDATENYQDTQARLKTQQALMDRLTGMMTETADLSDLLELEDKIAQTQYQIDRYQSSLNATDRKVAYSTVEINLTEEKETEQVQYRDVSFGERIGLAFENGLDAFAEFMEDMLLFLAEALPLLLCLAVIILIIVCVVRALRRKHHRK